MHQVHQKHSSHRRDGHPTRLLSLTGASLAMMGGDSDLSVNHYPRQQAPLPRNLKKLAISRNDSLIPLQFGFLFRQPLALQIPHNPLSGKPWRNKAVMAMWRLQQLAPLPVSGRPWVAPLTRAHPSRSRLDLVQSVLPRRFDSQLLLPYVQPQIGLRQ